VLVKRLFVAGVLEEQDLSARRDHVRDCGQIYDGVPEALRADVLLLACPTLATAAVSQRAEQLGGGGGGKRLASIEKFGPAGDVDGVARYAFG
jgi:hypothetical protein